MGFVSETTVKSVRKRHRCDGCGHHIEIGEPAVRCAGMTDGEFSTATYHPDCRKAEIALNDLYETHWSDDWMSLRDFDLEDSAWLIEGHPTVAARLGLIEPPDARPPLAGGG